MMITTHHCGQSKYKSDGIIDFMIKIKQKKKTAIVLLSFLGERYFTMGIVKIYNVLGEVFTVIIVSPWSLKVLTNMHKFSIIFLYSFTIFCIEDELSF